MQQTVMTQGLHTDDITEQFHHCTVLAPASVSCNYYYWFILGYIKGGGVIVRFSLAIRLSNSVCVLSLGCRTVFAVTLPSLAV